MALTENLPFPRGQTFFGIGGTPNATDGDYLEGREFEVPDVNPVTGVRRSNQIVRLRVVRNTNAAVALLPKRLVTLEVGADYGKEVDGYAISETVRAFPVDEYLPAAGCPVNDLCYIVVGGPATCLTPLAQFANGLGITAGLAVCAQTANVTTGSTTAGRIDQITAVTTNNLGGIAQANRLGVAISACTSQGYNVDVLVHVLRW